jgi:valine--pyruvate aminotransferase
MELSDRGVKMSEITGIRSIMIDIAAAAGEADRWVNLSPGNPAVIPEVRQTWQRLEGEALAASFATASCRYGPSRGADRLVDAIVRYFGRRYGWTLDARNILVGPGSQYLSFVAATVFSGELRSGRRRLVLPSSPDYTGYQGLSLDSGGVAALPPRIVLDEDRYFHYELAEDAIRRREDIGLMLLSSPANPTGRSLRVDELEVLLEVARARDVPLMIDHAYGHPFPQVAADSTEPVLDEHVIHSFTLSKAGLPGERLGFVIGAPEVIDAMVAFTANTALHAPGLVQMVAAEALDRGTLDRLAATVIRPYYRRKRQAAEDLLHKLMPEDVNWRLHASDGGMFCWLWIDEDWFDDLVMYAELKSRKVFIVPGRHFFVDPLGSALPGGHARRCIRLSLSADEPVIEEGIGRVAEALEAMSRAH